LESQVFEKYFEDIEKRIESTVAGMSKIKKRIDDLSIQE